MAPGVVFDGSESNAESRDSSDAPAPPPLPPQINNGLPTWREKQQLFKETIPPTPAPVDQFANLPAALLSNLKREKKPFTYTPGGIDLSEIKSPRMQKRLEANKRLQGVVSPLARPPEACGSEESKNDIVVLPVYNSPLDLYSIQNAREELQKQATLLTKELESVVCQNTSGEGNRYNAWSSPRGSSDYSSKYGQSRSFRMLQLMTDTTDDKEDTPYEPPPPKHEEDEMRFTGIIRDPVPSRFFHTLQKITGTDGGVSPEPPAEIQYDSVACPLQSATYGRDFVPPPKPSLPFEPTSNSTPSGWTAPSRNENASQRNSYPQFLSKEEPPMSQTNNQSNSQNQNFNPIGHARSFSSVYQQKNPQPFIRPNFQASKTGTIAWQPSNNAYTYCTLPRGYRGIPGIDGTDL